MRQPEPLTRRERMLLGLPALPAATVRTYHLTPVQNPVARQGSPLTGVKEPTAGVRGSDPQRSPR
jgi:hypothetical protein